MAPLAACEFLRLMYEGVDRVVAFRNSQGNHLITPATGSSEVANKVTMVVDDENVEEVTGCVLTSTPEEGRTLIDTAEAVSDSRGSSMKDIEQSDEDFNRHADALLDGGDEMGEEIAT